MLMAHNTIAVPYTPRGGGKSRQVYKPPQLDANWSNRPRASHGRYGRVLKSYFDSKAFARSGRAERHAQYLREQADKKEARGAS